MTTHEIDFNLDFTDPELWGERVPTEEFAQLRRSAPVWWCEQSDAASVFGDGGYWVVSKHADVRAVSRDSGLFSSELKTAIIRYPEGSTLEDIDSTRALLVNMDAPKHPAHRRIISRGFTPKAINALRSALTTRAHAIVEEAKAAGEGDFVDQVARELPLQAIAELLGVPQEDRFKLFEWSNQCLIWDDEEFDADPRAASAELVAYAWQMAEDRRNAPLKDIVTQLVTADVDGKGLESDEFAFFVMLLVIAGNETTRNAITHGMKAFVDHPQQWELYKKTRPTTAADEIVRWGTPVSAFQRAATRDTVLNGTEIKAGQRLGLFYSSANFDDDVFADPFKFDITRDPNPHLGFGGTGAHFCVGASLARLEIDIMFNAIADVLPDLTQVSEPQRVKAPWVNGIKHWNVRY